MVPLNVIIKKFGEQGEKTGWTYIDIPNNIAELLFPGKKTSFRVKGLLDKLAIKQIALIPMGGGNFILPLKAAIRKELNKRVGEQLKVKLEFDDSPTIYNMVLMSCLDDSPEALLFFSSLTPGHKRYFSNWIEAAKTEPTRLKRVAQAINALGRSHDYGTMIRTLNK